MRRPLPTRTEHVRCTGLRFLAKGCRTLARRFRLPATGPTCAFELLDAPVARRTRTAAGSRSCETRELHARGAPSPRAGVSLPGEWSRTRARRRRFWSTSITMIVATRSAFSGRSWALPCSGPESKIAVGHHDLAAALVDDPAQTTADVVSRDPEARTREAEARYRVAVHEHGRGGVTLPTVHECGGQIREHT